MKYRRHGLMIHQMCGNTCMNTKNACRIKLVLFTKRDTYILRKIKRQTHTLRG